MGRTRTALYAAAAFLALSLLLGAAWWAWFREEPSLASAGGAEPSAASPGQASADPPAPATDDPAVPPAAAAPAPPSAPALLGEPGPPPAFQPGRYRVTVNIINKLRDGQSQGPFVDEQCLSTEDPAPRGHVPPGCRHFEQRHEGSEYSWRIRCMGQRMGDGVGKARLAPGGKAIEGTIRLWLPNPITSAPQRNDQTFRGQRVGDC